MPEQLRHARDLAVLDRNAREHAEAETVDSLQPAAQLLRIVHDGLVLCQRQLARDGPVPEPRSLGRVRPCAAPQPGAAVGAGVPVGRPRHLEAVVLEAQLARADVERNRRGLQQPLSAAGVTAERARAVVAQPGEGKLAHFPSDQASVIARPSIATSLGADVSVEFIP